MNEGFLDSVQNLSMPLSPLLDGSQGSNRASFSPLIKADNDLAAVNCWLAEYANKPNTTYRHYKRDAERLLLWAMLERQKPLSSLDAEDLLAFSQFLDDPRPVERWCSGKTQKHKRFSPDWRPFVGPLGQAAKTKVLANLRSLFKYLQEMDYMARNPFKAISRQIRKSDSQAELRWQRGKRILGLAEWNAIQEVLAEMPEESLQSRQEKSRTKFLVALLFFLGLRVEELCQHKMKDFKKEFDHRAQKDRWWLVVKGKGDKLRKIPVNQSLLQALINYRQALGLEALPCDEQQEEPLLGSLRGRGKISPARVNQIIKTLCQKAALKFEPLDEKALKLKKVSAHWFRHLSFSMQDLVNIKKQHIKENAGHESEATTALYVHALDDFRHEEMEKLSWKIEIFKEPDLVGVS